MKTYRLIVADDEEARTIEIGQDVIDQSPALRAILERSFMADNSLIDGFDQSYDQTSKHDKYHEDREFPGGYSRSYTRKV